MGRRRESLTKKKKKNEKEREKRYLVRKEASWFMATGCSCVMLRSGWKEHAATRW